MQYLSDTGNEGEEKSPSKTRIQLLESQSKVASLNLEVSNLKERTGKLRMDLDKCNEELSRYEERERKSKEEIAIYKANCKESQANTEVELKNRILNLESELKKQRERCMTIIEEKEDEVNMLKSNMETTLEAAFRAAAKTAAKSALGNESSISENNDLRLKNQQYGNQSLYVDDSYSSGAGSVVESVTSNNGFSATTNIPSAQRLRRSKSGSVSRDQVSQLMEHYINGDETFVLVKNKHLISILVILGGRRSDGYF